MAPRRKSWKLGSCVFGGLFLIVLIVLWDIHRRAGSIIAEHEREVQGAGVIVLPDTSPVPSIYGNPLPGNGWLLLKRGIEGLDSMPDPDQEELSAFTPDETYVPDRDALDRVFSAYDAYVDDIRRALRHETITPGMPFDLVPLVTANHYLHDAAVHANYRSQGSRAVDLVLLNVSLSHRIGTGEGLVGRAFFGIGESIGLSSVKAVLFQHTLSGSDLERLSKGLSSLWGERANLYPEFLEEDRDIRGKLIRFIDTGDVFHLGDGRTWDGPSWQNMFSRRLAVAATLPRLRRLYKQVLALEEFPTWERARKARELMRSSRGEQGTLLRACVVGVVGFVELDAEHLTEWALAHMSVALARYEVEHGSAPASLEALIPDYLPEIPVCPYSGRPLGYVSGRVWCIGSDGVDDQGLTEAVGFGEGEKGDIVWHVAPR